MDTTEFICVAATQHIWLDEDNVSLFKIFSFSVQTRLQFTGSTQTQSRTQECYLLVSRHIKEMSGYYTS